MGQGVTDPPPPDAQTLPGIELLSVHVPKCGGMSLQRAIVELFGESRVHLDYDDRPLDPTSPMNIDPSAFFQAMARGGATLPPPIAAVHGHFNPRKYAKLPRRLAVTFLREPVERLVSHYFYWRSVPRHGHRLHNHLLDHGLTLEQFAELPAIRSIYTGVFFAGMDMRGFDLIGFHDRLAEDHGRLRGLLGIDHPIGHRIGTENANADPVYRHAKADLSADARRMASLRDKLRDDIAFYEKLRSRA